MEETALRKRLESLGLSVEHTRKVFLFFNRVFRTVIDIQKSGDSITLAKVFNKYIFYFRRFSTTRRQTASTRRAPIILK